MSAAISLFTFIMVLAGSAEALRVTHIFEGEVTSLVGDAIPPEFTDALGKRFAYTVSYDTSISGSERFLPQGPADQDPFEASYRARVQRVEPPDPELVLFEFVEPPTTFEFLLGGVTIDVSTPPPETFTFAELREIRGPAITVSNNSLFLGSQFGLSSPDGFNFGPIILIDSSRAVFSDVSLPLILQLADFDIAELIIFQQVGLFLAVSLGGTIDGITTTVVPEPSTALLLGLGLAGLGVGERRNHSRRC